jgi:hypothetical protein
MGTTMIKNFLGTSAAVALAASFAVLALAGSAQAKAFSWQSAATYDPATGQQSLEYTYNCPAGYIAISGGYEFNSVGQADDIALGASGPRFDSNNYNAWAWHIYWPNGALAGEVITFNAVCEK